MERSPNDSQEAVASAAASSGISFRPDTLSRKMKN